MAAATVQETTQYLTFGLGDEIYALDIGKVREVLDFTSVTRVPRTPDFMRGVINLRGSVVPVVDLRLKLDMGKTEKSVNTCVIITEVTVDNDIIVLGCLADSVQEVLSLEPGQISPPPKIGTNIRAEFVTGMGMQDNRFIILLDINRIVSVEEIACAVLSAESSLE
jgi:purine-binding chemotaxis protein CheW